MCKQNYSSADLKDLTDQKTAEVSSQLHLSLLVQRKIGVRRIRDQDCLLHVLLSQTPKLGLVKHKPIIIECALFKVFVLVRLSKVAANKMEMRENTNRVNPGQS